MVCRFSDSEFRTGLSWAVPHSKRHDVNLKEKVRDQDSTIVNIAFLELQLELLETLRRNCDQCLKREEMEVHVIASLVWIVRSWLF